MLCGQLWPLLARRVQLALGLQAKLDPPEQQEKLAQQARLAQQAKQGLAEHKDHKVIPVERLEQPERLACSHLWRRSGAARQHIFLAKQ